MPVRIDESRKGTSGWQWTTNNFGNTALTVLFATILIYTIIMTSAEIYVDSYDNHTFRVYVTSKNEERKQDGEAESGTFILTYATYRGFWNEEDEILYLSNEGSQLEQLGQIYVTSRNLVSSHCATATVADDIVIVLLISATFFLTLTLLLFLLHLRMSLHRRCPLVLMLTTGTNCLCTAYIVRYLRGYEVHACLQEHSYRILPSPKRTHGQNTSSDLKCFQEALWSLNTPKTGAVFFFFRVSSVVLICLASTIVLFSWLFGDTGSDSDDNDDGGTA